MDRRSEEIDLDTFCKMGFPTFDEFRKNPDKWRKDAEELFGSVEGSHQDPFERKRLHKQKYMWRDQYKCDSIEQLQRIAASEGYPNAQDLEICPIKMLIDGTNKRGRTELVVQFWPKWEWKLKGKVLTNDDA
jgi:hypothetical protein